MNCPYCGSGGKKFGSFKNRNGVVQRYRCKYCGRTFNELHAFSSIRLDDAKVAQIVHLLTEGCGIRATARLSGCDKNTVLGVLRTVGEKCHKFHDQIVRNVAVDSFRKVQRVSVEGNIQHPTTNIEHPMRVEERCRSGECRLSGGTAGVEGARHWDTAIEPLANTWRIPSHHLSSTYPTPIRDLSDTGRMRENHAFKAAKRRWQCSHKALSLNIRPSV